VGKPTPVLTDKLAVVWPQVDQLSVLLRTVRKIQGELTRITADEQTLATERFNAQARLDVVSAKVDTLFAEMFSALETASTVVLVDPEPIVEVIP